MFGMFRHREPERHPAEMWHDMREAQWNRFIKHCEKFDYIKIKDGCAVGYMVAELPELQPEPEPSNGGRFVIQFMKGTKLLIPFEMVKMRYTE